MSQSPRSPATSGSVALDLRNRRAKVRRKGSTIDVIVWQTATARLLPRLLAGRTSGPVFLTDRCARLPLAPVDVDSATGRARLSYRRAAELFESATTGAIDGAWTLHRLRHSALTHAAPRAPACSPGVGPTTPRPPRRSRPQLRRSSPPGTVLDGELVVWHGDRLDFAALQHRAMSPRHSDVLAQSMPASFVAFDVLTAAGVDLRGQPLPYRRQRLEQLLPDLARPCRCPRSPATRRSPRPGCASTPKPRSGSKAWSPRAWRTATSRARERG